MGYGAKQATTSKDDARAVIDDEYTQARGALKEQGHPVNVPLFVERPTGDSLLRIRLDDLSAADRESLLTFIEAGSIRHTIQPLVEYDKVAEMKAIVSAKMDKKAKKPRGRIIYNLNAKGCSVPGLGEDCMFNGNLFPGKDGMRVVVDDESAAKVFHAKQALAQDSDSEE